MNAIEFFILASLLGSAFFGLVLFAAAVIIKVFWRDE